MLINIFISALYGAIKRC